MHILIVTRLVHKNYGPWVDILLSAGHSVTFLNFGTDALRHPSAKVITLRTKSLPGFMSKFVALRTIFGHDASIVELVEMLRAERPDVVICREFSMAVLKTSVLSRLLLKKPKILYYDQQYVDSHHKFRRLARLLVSRQVITPCCRDYEVEKLMEFPVKVIPFACTANVSAKDLAMKYSDILERRIKVVVIGKLYFEHYNYAALFDSLVGDLRSALEITVIGRTRASLPHIEREIDRRAEQINLSGGAIKILKDLPHSEVKRRLHEADLFCLPGYSQVASYSQFEAMGFGLPVIICKDNGTAYAIKDRFNGLVVERTADSIREAFLKVVSDRCDLESMALNSLKRARDDFSHATVKTRFEELFSSGRI